MTWRTQKYTGPERRRKPRWRPRPIRVLAVLLALAAVGYAGGALWLMTQETRLTFQAVQTLGDTRPPFPYDQIDIPRPDDARQFAWLMRGDAGDSGPWALYLHGNPTTIASPVNIAHYTVLRSAGLNVLAPEYRGFGGLDGVLTESGVVADARAAYDYLRAVLHVAPSRIVIHGWSLGSAVAIDLATQVPVAGVIVEGAPASMVEVNRRRYPFFPVRALMRHPFDSIARIARVEAPLLFLHGPEDAVVPIADARRLFDAARGRKAFVELPGGHMHASEVGREQMTRAITEFLASEGIAPEEGTGAQER